MKCAPFKSFSKSPRQNIIKLIAVLAIITPASAVFGHVVLEDQTALAGRSYKAVLKVGHGCEGSPTTAMRVTIPAGFMGAKPMPKAGWKLDIKTAKLAVPYDSYGKQVAEDVSEITWTATSKDSWLPEAHYDEFVMRGGLPKKDGAMSSKCCKRATKARTTGRKSLLRASMPTA